MKIVVVEDEYRIRQGLCQLIPKLSPEFTAELDRRYQITDGILRTIIIKRDPRHVKAQKTEEKNIDVEAIAAEAVESSAE